MITFETNGSNGKYLLNLPTSIDEVKDNYLKEFGNEVEVADDYILVALLYREKLANIILSDRQNKNKIDAAVIPLFVKGGVQHSQFIYNIPFGAKVVISGSDLSLGHHVYCVNNHLTINKVLWYTQGDGFAYQNALKNNQYCYFIEFKIIPASAIHGVYNEVDVKPNYTAVKLNAE